ncbi:MAG TPA: tetratricopeptide repeat protein [Methylomirabilota bacterium]|nr:tetratricopeptide repeat protein [Methylomirabilota bacterium]
MGILAGVFLARRAPVPAPPMVDLEGFDPVIATAIAEARTNVLRAPREAATWGHLGMALLAHDLRAPAREALAQAAMLAPREPRWPYFLAMAQRVDAPPAAATNFARAVALFGDRETLPRLRLADTLLSLGRLDEAEPHYRELWRRDTNAAPAALGLGRIAISRERPAEAVDFLIAAAQHPSTRKAAHRLMLGVQQRLGHTNVADQISHALEQLPNDAPLPDSIYAEVERLQTGEKAWIDRGDEWIKAGRVAEAAALLERAVQTYPRSDRAMFFLGRARLRLGDVAGAEAILSRAVALAPDSVEAQMQLGVVRLSQGRARAAEPCFRAAIRAKPNLGEAWYNLGLSLGVDAHRAESIAAFREALRLKPNLVEAYLGLAVALQADGQREEAAATLRRALEFNPPEALRGKLLDQLQLAAP